MPIYEYACDACGYEFEREQRISEDPVKTCPKCRARKARRLISRTSFLLKGGGWYKDLYSSAKSGKGKSKSKDKGQGGGSKESSSSSGSKGKDAKPAGGSEKKGSAGSEAAA